MIEAHRGAALWQTDTQIDSQTDTQADTQTGRQTHRHKDGEIDTQM